MDFKECRVSLPTDRYLMEPFKECIEYIEERFKDCTEHVKEFVNKCTECIRNYLGLAANQGCQDAKDASLSDIRIDYPQTPGKNKANQSCQDARDEEFRGVTIDEIDPDAFVIPEKKKAKNN
ncbi:PREDICTED: uncharacterized protein LOC109583353 [Amphimedon queenslandica]|nr:PREDICTED: uncharacterized protein LOC109583353 [Amphimedon queenslandica]XP_019854221.1 PREDICTED: uncharacterized protein LOC109583353 [Amphimedon queenslandica]|eukprot:XP_019854220.1 PREDICTED: uncharacterized protein LOC109583353 [Amphimedon queenslandica]